MSSKVNNINISTMFLLPGIEIKSELKRSFRSFGFVNTYLFCEELTYPYPVIYLLFKPEKLNYDFYEFTENLQKSSSFIEFIDLAQGILAVYRVPKKFTRDYELFLQGKYSKLSDAFKSCFVLEDFKRDEKGNFVKIGNKYVPEPTTFYHVFNRTDFLKNKWKEKLGYRLTDPILDDIELYEKQDEEKETFVIGYDLL